MRLIIGQIVGVSFVTKLTQSCQYNLSYSQLTHGRESAIVGQLKDRGRLSIPPPEATPWQIIHNLHGVQRKFSLHSTRVPRQTFTHNLNCLSDHASGVPNRALPFSDEAKKGMLSYVLHHPSEKLADNET